MFMLIFSKIKVFSRRLFAHPFAQLKLEGPRAVVVATAVILLSAVGLVWGYGSSNNQEGLILDLDLSRDNYTAATKVFIDKSGVNNNILAATTSVFTVNKEGKVGGARYFTNTPTDYVRVANFNLPTNNQLSFEFLLRSATSSGTHVILADAAQSSSVGFLLIYQSGGSFVFQYVDNVNYKTTSFSSIFNDAQTWKHLVLVADYDADTVSLYVNGALNRTNAMTAAIPPVTNARTVFIGSYNSNYASNWLGEMAAVKIWNKLLTAAEIKQIYNGAKAKMQASSLEKGLIGYWPLNGENYNASNNRVTDKSAYSNHGLNSGATLTTDRFGRANGAMQFNGINNKISISYPNPVQQTSVVAWFKRTGAPAGNYHIITGGQNVEISINDPGGFLRTGVTTNTQGRKVFNSGSGLLDGRWHQVALTYDGTNVKSFIDGQLTATNAASGNLVGTATEIGRYLSDTYVANGAIAEVRVYNRALADTEINSLYSLDKSKVSTNSLQKGLVFDMPLTSKYTKSATVGSEIMTDRTPYSHDGQNVGALIGTDGATFNGSNYITFNNPLNQSATNQEWSVSAWVNINDADSQILINNFNRGLSLNYSSTKKLLLYLNTSPNDYYLYGNATGLLANQGWKHVVFVFRNSDGLRKIYIDGVDKSGTGPNQSSTPLGIAAQLRIGQGVVGTIANVRIYNRALSQEEAKSLFGQGRRDAGLIFNGL